MSFLQVGALWALPLVLMPLLIHLVHGRRHPTTQWAAMVFLQRAINARRGPTKVRRWLILFLRMALVAGLVFALARPLSSGLFGLAAGRVADASTTIVVMDRSPSMSRRLSDGRTFSQSAAHHVAEALRTLGVAEFVLIDSIRAQPVLVRDPKKLLEQPVVAPCSAMSDVVGLLARSLDYLDERGLTQADIWLCSDGQSSDWNPEDLRWSGIRERFVERGETLRVYHSAAEHPRLANRSVSITDVQTTGSGDARQVELRCEVIQSDRSEEVVPVRLTLGGVTTTVDVTLEEGVGRSMIKLPLDRDAVPGKASIPADENNSDNQFFFVTDSVGSGRIGILADPPSDALEAVVEVFGGRSADTNDLDGIDCLVGLGPIPDDRREAIDQFVRSGGHLILFPSSNTGTGTILADVNWMPWSPDGAYRASFEEIPFLVERFTAIDGEVVKLATTSDGRTLIGKRSVGKGTVWFCGGDVNRARGKFVNDGVVLFGLFSKIMSEFGAGIESNSRVVGQVAGTLPERLRGGAELEPVAGFASNTDDFGFHAGVFQLANDSTTETQLYAINSPTTESRSPMLSALQVKDLLGTERLSAFAVDVSSNADGRSPVRELWGVIWVALLVVMIVEAIVSLPVTGAR